MSSEPQVNIDPAAAERGNWRPVQVFRAIELLREVMMAIAPADRVMEGFFRRHRDMGSKDRGRVAEAVYACLRQRRLYETLAGSPDNPEALLAVYLLREAGWSGRALARFEFHVSIDALTQRVRTTDVAALSLAVRASWPDWLADELRKEFDDAELERLAEALNQPAPVDIRVNTHKASRDEVAAQLASAGYPMEPARWSPAALRRANRAPLFNTQAFRNGLFEVQDEGSQLVSLLLAPKRRQTIVDFCAGGGGKALHLASLMENTGLVYACDVNPKRLQNLKPRILRAQLDNIQLMPLADENDAQLERLVGKADGVLVDAPCSGTGTLRRNPDIKWRQIDLAALSALQLRILNSACKLVKPGGLLVYATCSLLQCENQDVARAFLAGHAEFNAENAADILRFAQVDVGDAVTADGHLRLLPHRHNADGFFAAAFRRAK